MKFHPYAEVFPLMDDERMAELIEDIKSNGLAEPIWRYKGQILDGRNRFLACQKAKVKPRFRDYTGADPLSFVLSLNVHRRHLSDAQRAFAAAKIANLRHGQTRAELPIGNSGITQQAAADLLNVSKRGVIRASKVLHEGSRDLQRAVEAGEVSVSRAASVVDLPKSEQLGAATAEHDPLEEGAYVPEDNELERLAEMDRQERASIEKVMGADDKLAAAHAEIKRQAAEIAVLKQSRDGYQNAYGECVRRIKKLKAQVSRLQKAPAEAVNTNGVAAHP